MSLRYITRRVLVVALATVIGLSHCGFGPGISPASAGVTTDLMWTVPAGVEVVQLTLVGGQGGNADTATGGAGGHVTTSLLVNEGDAFRIGLGADGESASAGGRGGLNGLSIGSGGNGGTGGLHAGGGGGASVAKIDPVGPIFNYLTVAIASGGGGAGGGAVGGAGGSAGNFSASGTDGGSGYWGGFTMLGGTGATEMTPGSASGAVDGATDGISIDGGDGGSAGYASGGGGGSGVYGGGGGASDTHFNPGTPPDQGGGGGGAGSSWVTTDSMFIDSTVAYPQYVNSRTQTSSIEWIAFDTTTLPAGTVGTAYVADVDATFRASTQATDFSISPALPSGLSLNTSTGVISGTPTVASSVSYEVTAETLGIASRVVARSVTTLTLTVSSDPTPSPDPVNSTTPPALSEDMIPQLRIQGSDSASLTVGVETETSPITIVNSGTYANYSITPELPSGLELTNGGFLAGTPTVESPLTRYVVRASNPAGTSEVSFWLSVNPQPTIMETVESEIVVVGFRNRSLTHSGPGWDEAKFLVASAGAVIRARSYANTGMNTGKAKLLSTKRLNSTIKQLGVSVANSRPLGNKERIECAQYRNNCVVLVVRTIVKSD